MSKMNFIFHCSRSVLRCKKRFVQVQLLCCCCKISSAPVWAEAHCTVQEQLQLSYFSVSCKIYKVFIFKDYGICLKEIWYFSIIASHIFNKELINFSIYEMDIMVDWETFLNCYHYLFMEKENRLVSSVN